MFPDALSPQGYQHVLKRSEQPDRTLKIANGRRI